MNIKINVNVVGIWEAIDDSTYDGVGPIGYGETEQEAEEDLMLLLMEREAA